MKTKLNTKTIVAAVASVIGLAVYGYTSMVGYLAASATSTLPVVLTVAALVCLALRQFTGSKAYAAVCGKLARQPVQVHAARSGSFRFNALRAQPGNNARKHIAAAAGCHGRRTRGVNIHCAVRAADNRRRAFQHQHAVPFCGIFFRKFNAAHINFGCA